MKPQEKNPIMEMIKDILTEVRSMTPDERRLDLAKCAADMGTAVIRLAAHVRVAEDNGEDLEKFRENFGREFLLNLRRVASGTLHPLAVRRFCFERPSLLNAIRDLPPNDQQRIASGGDEARVEVVTIQPNGMTAIVRRDPELLSGDALKQVFRNGHIANVEEQRAYLESQIFTAHKRNAPMPDEVEGCKIDEERREVVVGRHRIPFDTWLRVGKAIQK